ncbi:MAG TPA: FAD-dependent oxidoreductase [Paenibacillus sp.]|nr:FAD-dependent oxidoreductase [Paenibacillus sp.]
MKTIVIVGGGYAGLNAAKLLEKQLGRQAGQSVRLVLIDKESYHFRRMILFKAAAGGALLKVPFAHVLGKRIEFVQGSMTEMNAEARTVTVETQGGVLRNIVFDRLVLALGSTIVPAPAEYGGISLHNVPNAKRVRQEILANIQKARLETQAERRRDLLSVAVAGGGITGIETAAELIHWMRQEVQKVGLDPSLVQVALINSKKRLMAHIHEPFARRVERSLKSMGVQLVHGVKAVNHHSGRVALDDGRVLKAAVCVWTLGLKPNPMLPQFNLPMDNTGRLLTDPHYRVRGYNHIYAIGDCANIVDPATGKEDEMTCKEAVGQATRLAKIIKAELQGKTAEAHKSYMNLYCVGLGPKEGMLWAQPVKGVNIYLTGKLGLFARHTAWNLPSFVDRKLTKRLAAAGNGSAETTAIGG